MHGFVNGSFSYWLGFEEKNCFSKIIIDLMGGGKVGGGG